MYHSVTCVGYGFIQEKKKLKQEYIGVQGKQLGELRKNGIVIDYLVENPMFAFLGDTTIQFFEEHSKLKDNGEPSIFRYPLIIVECTFLGSDELDQERADKKKHINWPRLKPYIEAHSKILFVLIHFSRRYNDTTIRDFFEKENLVNVVPFVESKDISISKDVVDEERDY
jgi:ribonuclease Z